MIGDTKDVDQIFDRCEKVLASVSKDLNDDEGKNLIDTSLTGLLRLQQHARQLHRRSNNGTKDDDYDQLFIHLEFYVRHVTGRGIRKRSFSVSTLERLIDFFGGLTDEEEDSLHTAMFVCWYKKKLGSVCCAGRSTAEILDEIVCRRMMVFRVWRSKFNHLYQSLGFEKRLQLQHQNSPEEFAFLSRAIKKFDLGYSEKNCLLAVLYDSSIIDIDMYGTDLDIKFFMTTLLAAQDECKTFDLQLQQAIDDIITSFIRHICFDYTKQIGIFLTAANTADDTNRILRLIYRTLNHAGPTAIKEYLGIDGIAELWDEKQLPNTELMIECIIEATDLPDDLVKLSLNYVWSQEQ
jgi:hypothetical protein